MFLIVLGQQWERNELYQALDTQETLAGGINELWFWFFDSINII